MRKQVKSIKKRPYIMAITPKAIPIPPNPTSVQVDHLSFLFPNIQSAVFIGIVVLMFFATVYKLEYGLYILLAELFIGGKGYLFSINVFGTPISIRIAFFIILFAIWLGILLKKKYFHFQQSHFQYYFLL